MLAASLAQKLAPLIPAPLLYRLKASPVARRIASGSIWGLWGSVISRVLALGSMIVLARILGPQAFGQFGLVQSTIGVAGLMAGIGFGTTATRFIASHARERERIGRIIGLLNQLTCTVLTLAVLLVLWFAPAVANGALHSQHLQRALWIGSALLTANVLRGVQSGILAGLERFDRIAHLNIVEGIASCALVPPLGYLGGLEGGIAGLAIGSLLAWLIGERMKSLLLANAGVRVSYRGAWRDWRILTGYSLPSLLANLVATPVLWYSMTMLARAPGGYEALGLYNAAYQWQGPLIFLPMIIMSSSIPVLVQEWEHGSRANFRRTTTWIALITLAATLAPAVVVALSAKPVMSFYGRAFAGGWSVLVVLVLAAPLHALTRVASGALYGMNRAWRVFASNLTWGVLLIATATLLIPAQGALGLAVAFLIAYAAHAAICVSFVLIESGGSAKAKHEPALGGAAADSRGRSI
jgi:O-antigen/teichoic acid export membrane protein